MNQSVEISNSAGQAEAVYPLPSSRPQRSIPAAAPVLVLAMALLLTATATAYVAFTVRQRERLSFTAKVQQINDTLSARFDTYLSVLRGASGLFSSDTNVTRDDFQAYVKRLEIEQHYPGVRAVGVSISVHNAKEGAALVASQRAQGADKYHLWPPEPPGPNRQAVLYLEPRQKKSPLGLGYDQRVDPVRKIAMERARDEGIAVATGRLLLLQNGQEERHPGFVVYLPVYAGGETPPTVEARRAALFGYVYLPFRSVDMIQNVLAESDRDKWLSLQAYDGDGAGPDDLLYATQNGPRRQLFHQGDLSATMPVPVAGRTWLVSFAPSANFQRGDTDLTLWTLGLGLLITGLLFNITLALARSRDTAEETAVRLTKSEEALRENESRQRAFFRDVLASVTEGRLRLCDSDSDLPPLLPPIAEVALEKPTLRRLRHAVRDAATTAGFPDERVHDLVTAVGEAAMNAVVHAGGGTGTVAVNDQGMMQIVIRDTGAGIDMHRLPRATLERGFTTAGSLGHGFFLMLHSADRVWLMTGPDGTCVILEQDAVPSEPAWLLERMTPPVSGV